MKFLEPGETVSYEVHKHWYAIFPRIVAFFVLALAPSAVIGLLVHFLPVNFGVFASPSVTTLFYSLWLMFLLLSFFISWTDYYFDVWLVTNKRIIAIEQTGILHVKTSDLRFDRIQDISIEQNGFMQTMMKFGDITIKTAVAGDNAFVMKNASNPEKARQFIFSHHTAEEEKVRPVSFSSVPAPAPIPMVPPAPQPPLPPVPKDAEDHSSNDGGYLPPNLPV